MEVMNENDAVQFAEFLNMPDPKYIVLRSDADSLETKIVTKENHENLFNCITRMVQNGYDGFDKIAEVLDRENHPECEAYYELSGEERLDHPEHEEISERVRELEEDLHRELLDIDDAYGMIPQGWLFEIECPL